MIDRESLRDFLFFNPFPPGEAVYVLSGGKCSFKATLLAVGEQTTIKIKSDYREASLLLSRSGTNLRQ